MLCWFFIVSHNLASFLSQLSKNQGGLGAVADQASATWGNAFWSFLSGGLNYQIEHHMFPGTA